MKRYYVVSALLCIHVTIMQGMQGQKQKKTQQTPVLINIAPGFTNYQTDKSATTNTNTTDTRVAVRQETSVWLHDLIGQLPNPHKITESMMTYVKAHKYKVALYSFAGMYLLTCSTLIFGNYYLQRKDLWCTWKNHLSHEQLYGIPQKELAKDLIRDIQRRYMSHQNPTDCIFPLVRFIEAIEKEQKYLKRYIAFGNMLKKCKIFFLFPLNQKSMQQAEKQLQRLTFISHIFMSWSAEHNISSMESNRADHAYGKSSEH